MEFLNIFIGKLRARLYNLLPNIKIGANTIIEKNVQLRIINKGKIVIGENCHIYSGAQLQTWGGFIIIKNDVTINPYTVLYGNGGVSIGNGVRIAAHTTIVSANHVFKDPNIYIMNQGMDKKGIIIEDDVWIGSGVRILDGVTIRRGCVIGANAVVTHSTDKLAVYVGVPAQKIKDR